MPGIIRAFAIKKIKLVYKVGRYNIVSAISYFKYTLFGLEIFYNQFTTIDTIVTFYVTN